MSIRVVRLLGADDPVDLSDLDPIDLRRMRTAEAMRRLRIRRGAKPRGAPVTSESKRKRNRIYYQKNAERLKKAVRDRARHEREFHIMHYPPSGRARSAKAAAAARWKKEAPTNLAQPKPMPNRTHWWRKEFFVNYARKAANG